MDLTANCVCARTKKSWVLLFFTRVLVLCLCASLHLEQSTLFLAAQALTTKCLLSCGKPVCVCRWSFSSLRCTLLVSALALTSRAPKSACDVDWISVCYHPLPSVLHATRHLPKSVRTNSSSCFCVHREPWCFQEEKERRGERDAHKLPLPFLHATRYLSSLS